MTPEEIMDVYALPNLCKTERDEMVAAMSIARWESYLEGLEDAAVMVEEVFDTKIADAIRSLKKNKNQFSFLPPPPKEEG
jgi:hypothetical protein